MSEAEVFRIDVSALAVGKMMAVEYGDLSVLLCNVGGEIHAVENRCSHADVPLIEGELRGCELECAFHGAVFDVRDGRALARPASEPLRRFEVIRHRDGDGDWVTLGV